MSQFSSSSQRRRAYQCLKCYHRMDKVYIEAKYRVYNHFLKEHMSLTVVCASSDVSNAKNWKSMFTVSVVMHLCSRKKTSLTVQSSLSVIHLHISLLTGMLLSFLLKKANAIGSLSPRSQTSCIKPYSLRFQT
ncbi:hypothetical protein DPMN_054816 [Dreissena polymorpha]|uniref:Uncharacterized protein n=1 Tax=Dreissena polymorpha TaxID=45954 RepID=A0A9D4CNT4_DREPO|nr:hypothetical protein DPMN_054816 [Dreissena polymorpha]